MAHVHLSTFLAECVASSHKHSLAVFSGVLRYDGRMKTDYEKTGDVARRISIHPNTVRNYADKFSEFMSDTATSSKRKFTHEDILVLATIAEFRERGQEWHDIETALRNGQRVETVPALPSVAEETARQAMALVPKTEADRLRDDLARITRERDNLLIRLENIMSTASQERVETLKHFQEQIDDRDAQIKRLQDELGIAKGRLLESFPTRIWISLFIAVLVGLFLLGLLFVLNVS